jgi:hypothetical protein
MRAVLLSVSLAVLGVMALSPAEASAQCLVGYAGYAGYGGYNGPPYNSMDLAAAYQYPSKIPPSIYPESWPNSGWAGYGERPRALRYTAYPSWREQKRAYPGRGGNDACAP